MIQIGNLNQSTLLRTIGRNQAETDSLDDLGYDIAHELEDGSGSGLNNLWEQVKKEFRAFLCTDEARYAEVRKKTMDATPDYTTALIATISAGLGAAIGATAAAIAPLVGVLLLVLSRVGKNAICNLSWGA